MKIRVGARSSSLSLVQAEWVINSLQGYYPDAQFELKHIATSGDYIKDWTKIDKGVFVKEIEQALTGQDIDMAVHSMKDVPTTLASGLIIPAVCKRLNPLDVVINLHRFKLSELEKNAKVGTSSLRRKAQLLHFRPDLQIKDLRGNLDTRLKKLREEDFDAIIVAAVGLIRMGLDHMISEFISPQIMLPAAGQGMLAIETREKDMKVNEMVAGLNDFGSGLCSRAERAMLKALGGGCRLPVGGLAIIQDNKLSLDGMVASQDGKKILRAAFTGGLEEAEIVGNMVAEKLLSLGAKEILKNIKN